jgi:hypothetical protein
MNEQKKLRTKLWLETREITAEVRCGINLEAITNYIDTAGPEADTLPIHKDGTSYSKSNRNLLRDLKNQTKTSPTGESYVNLTYRRSKLATQYIAAGHITESREYSSEKSADPFHLPRTLRKIALRGIGHDFDDKAVFPRAKCALATPCSAALDRFLTHRETIMSQMGEFYLPDTFLRARHGTSLPPINTTDEEEKLKEIRRDGIKALFNSLDMDGTLGSWRKRQKIPPGQKPLRNLRIHLPNGLFDFGQYARTMEIGSRWLADQRRPAMKEITRQWFQLTRDPRIEHPERTLASYIFQEKEAISRNAKIAWCTQKGHKVHNLQHDGIIVSLATGEKRPELWESVNDHSVKSRKGARGSLRTPRVM